MVDLSQTRLVVFSFLRPDFVSKPSLAASKSKPWVGFKFSVKKSVFSLLYTDGGRVFAYAQGAPGTQHTKNVNPREKITILAPFDISWHHEIFTKNA